MWKSVIALTIVVMSFCGLSGQNLPDDITRIEGDKLIIRINTAWDSQILEEIISTFKLDSSMQLLFQRGFDKQFADSSSLNVKFLKNGWLEIIDDISTSQDVIDVFSNFFLLDESMTFSDQVTGISANYGFNKLKNPKLLKQNKSGISITLTDYKNARKVFIAGSFNNWDVSETPMKYTEEGWKVDLYLDPGEYYYKFILDGEWLIDPNNELTNLDTELNTNSVLFVNNYQFKLSRYKTAKTVNLAGSFNGFNPDEIKMEQDPISKIWMKNLFLEEGTHEYKFIIDNQWITDPDNLTVRPDGQGNENSIVEIGNPTEFHLSGFLEAKSVKLTGSFLNWSPEGDAMIKSKEGWKTSFTLGPGNYTYKYIVDGEWIPDPENPYSTGTEEFTNSVITIKPNHEFNLAGFLDAQIIYVTGNFNAWDESGFLMKKTDTGWTLPIRLSPGKYLYKIIVDGKWILDPGNELWEENEYDTGNSVLWIEY